MSERPRWTPRVINGGRAKVIREGSERIISSETITPKQLVEKWMEVTNNPPSDWSRSVRPELLALAAQTVKSYSVAQLYGALTAPGLWKRPSFVRAVTNEIAERMRSKRFEPTEFS